jgi:hypothetical protein
LEEALLEELDSDGDNAWSYDEVSNYASDYSTLTGNKIDVDDIFASYDTDGDNSLSSTEQVDVLSDDALGLDDISSDDSDSSTDLLDSIMSSSGGYSYLMSSLVQESTSSLLSQMFDMDDESSNLLSGVYDTTSVAEAAEAYWISSYEDSGDTTSSMDVTT